MKDIRIVAVRAQLDTEAINGGESACVAALVRRDTRAELAEAVDQLRTGHGVERSETWMTTSMRLAALPMGPLLTAGGRTATG